MDIDATIGLIHYQAGNIKSLASAFEWFGVDVVIVTKPDDFDDLTHIVLPGVGAFGHCAAGLRASACLDRLQDWALVERRPTMGVCVGMQLMADVSEEFGEHRGLGWIGGRVARLQPQGNDIRVPHVGWNTVSVTQPFAAYRQGQQDDYYFDHSYAYLDAPEEKILGRCNHGQSFAAIVGQDNILATQFHPEKSQKTGLALIESFLRRGQG